MARRLDSLCPESSPAALLEILEQAGIARGLFADCVPDPTTDSVDAARAADTRQTVIMAAVLLLVGGVIGAQIGTTIGTKLKAEQLRILLATLVLAPWLAAALLLARCQLRRRVASIT